MHNEHEKYCLVIPLEPMSRCKDGKLGVIRIGVSLHRQRNKNKISPPNINKGFYMGEGQKVGRGDDKGGEEWS